MIAKATSAKPGCIPASAVGVGMYRLRGFTKTTKGLLHGFAPSAIPRTSTLTSHVRDAQGPK